MTFQKADGRSTTAPAAGDARLPVRTCLAIWLAVSGLAWGGAAYLLAQL